MAFVFGLYLIVSLGRDVWFFWQREKEVGKHQLVLENLKGENEKLKEQYHSVQSPEFIEKEVREKLGLGRKGEMVVLIPEDLRRQAGQVREEDKGKVLPNWERWRRLFF